MDEKTRLLPIKHGFVVVMCVTALHHTSERFMYIRVRWMYYHSA
jgi:hypothetical protein